jgi:hypothetical protein
VEARNKLELAHSVVGNRFHVIDKPRILSLTEIISGDVRCRLLNLVLRSYHLHDYENSKYVEIAGNSSLK